MVENKIRSFEAQILSSQPGTERLRTAKAFFNLSSLIYDALPTLAPGIVNFMKLTKFEKKYLNQSTYSDLIVKGLEGNVTTTMGLRLGDIADLVRKSDALKAEFSNPDYATLPARIAALSGQDEFKKQFHSFMENYGMRAAAEIDIATERWNENMKPLALAVLSTVETAKEGAHIVEFRNAIDEAEKASEAFVREIAGKYGSSRAAKLKKMIRDTRNVLPLREHPKYMIIRLMWVMKKIILQEACELQKRGLLEDVQDVFYVDYWELISAVERGGDLKRLVNARKEEQEHFKHLKPPYVMTGDGEQITASYDMGGLPEGALMGIGVSSGVVEGVAKVIVDPTNAVLGKGEILVAPFTDPGWTPLFINAAGLVMELGGLLTHGTVVAREYGIPAVVGLNDATTKIKTGDRIRVDGNAGYVVILE